MRRPPYARWLAAVALVAAAAVIDLRGTPTQRHPYVTAAVAAGETIDDSVLQWRDLPAGVLPEIDLTNPVAARDLGAGEALLPGDLAAPPAVPSGWWAIPLPMPGDPAPGTAVRIVLTDTSTTIDGVVVAGPVHNGFNPRAEGLAAIPGEHAAAVAAAAIDQHLVVLIAP
jgi:hypothetical protein